MKNVCALSLLAALLFWSFSEAPGAEKVKVASGIKLSPVFYLPPVAAEEKGFWKENGIDGEYVPFESAKAAYAAVAGGHVVYGMTSTPSIIDAASRGLPAVIVLELSPKAGFYIWVRSDSRFKQGNDLKGGKLGVSGFGGAEHAYGRLAAAGLGLEKDVKFVGTGGIPSSLAALKTGAIDGVVLTIHQMISLKLKGEVRELVNIRDFHPKEWLGYVGYARKDFVANNPDLMRRAVKAIVQAMDFIRRNPAWTIEKMKSWQGYTEEVAKLVYEDIAFSKDGKINRKALENMRTFLGDFGVIPKEKIPAIEELYTDQFTR